MRRALVGLVLGLLLGFGAGWLVFAWPFDAEDTAPSVDEIEVELLRQLDDPNAESASCTQRQYPANVYDCQVIKGGSLPLPFRYRVTRRNDGRIVFSDLGVG